MATPAAADPLAEALVALLAELAEGTGEPGNLVVLNTGDGGLLASLAGLSAVDASRSSEGGATVAAHAQHLRFGLSLLNRWAREGGDPFADARDEEAWEISAVDEAEWAEIQGGLRTEIRRWSEALATRPPAGARDRLWMMGSLAHLAYHLGAVRQIQRAARGPREGTYSGSASG